MKDEIIPVSLKGLLGVISAFGSAQLTLSEIDLIFGIAAKAGGVLVALATLISICLTIRRQWRARNKPGGGSDTTRFLTIATALAVIGACGCSLLPTERQRSEAVKATEAIATTSERTTERTLEITPASAFEVYATAASNAPAVAQLPLVREQTRVTTRTDTGAGSRNSANGSTSVSIPMGVKIGLLGIGILILGGALAWAWRYVKSTAFGQGASLVHDLAARQIRKLRDRAALSTDPTEQARLQVDIAELEAERGKLASRK